MKIEEAREAVLSKITERDLVSTIVDLVRIPSITGNELEKSLYIENRMRQLGLKTELEDVQYGRPNLYGVLKGEGGGDPFLLLTHSDTEPPVEGQKNAFWGEVKNGAVYGLGAGDSMPGITAFLGALTAIKEARIRLKSNIVYSVVVEELTYSRGAGAFAKWMKRSGINPAMGLIGESTGLKIGILSTGIVEFIIETKGSAGHPGIAQRGVNAVLKMYEIINELQKMSQEDAPFVKEHPWCGKGLWYFGPMEGGFTSGPASPRAETGSLEPGEKSWESIRIQGPGAAALTPEFCKLRVGFRTVPRARKNHEPWSTGPIEGQETETIQNAIQSRIDKLKRNDPTLNCSVKLYRNLNAPDELSPDHEIVKIVGKNSQAVTGKRPENIYTKWWVETGILHSLGFNVGLVQYGGPEDTLLKPDEHCPIDKLVTQAKVYALSILDACGLA